MPRAIRNTSEVEQGIGLAMDRLRQALGLMPLLALVPACLLVMLALWFFVAAPLALLVPPFVWLARHSWHYERELENLYGADSPEVRP